MTSVQVSAKLIDDRLAQLAIIRRSISCLFALACLTALLMLGALLGMAGPSALAGIADEPDRAPSFIDVARPASPPAPPRA